MATGGYWYSAISGVCVRAYMKGHYGHENSWTGPVLGWRTTRQQEPEYKWHPPDHGTVNTLAMIGGIDSDDDISVLNPKKYADHHCYVDRSGIHAVAEVHYLAMGNRNIDLIRGANGGSLLFNAHLGKAQLIDCELPDLGALTGNLSPEACMDILWTEAHETEYSFFDL